MEKKRKILPLAWLLIALISMVGLHRFWPVANWLQPPWNWLGLFPLLFGLYMAAVSAKTFRSLETGLIPFDEATCLVTKGFFRYTRNPMYLGMVLFLAGGATLLGSIGSLFPVPLFAWIIQRNFILGEERFMETAFGDEFLAYKSRVRRWL